MPHSTVSRRRFIATTGIASLAVWSRPSAALHGQTAARPTTGIHPFSIEGDRLVVPRGRFCVGGREIEVKTRTELRIAPADVVTVRDEELFLSAKKPSGFFAGTQLRGTKAKNIGAMHALIEDSLTLRDAEGRTLRKDDDYLVSARFSLLGLGANPSVTVETKVFASYSYFTQRIDAVVVDAAGAVSLVLGTPRLASPDLPAVPAAATAICTLYRPFRGRTLREEHVFPIVASAEAAPTVTRRGRIPKTLRKLESGEPVTIVCWGDSITVGADVNPEDAWANALPRALRQKFPRAAIAHKNHSIGGTKTAQWLHNGDYAGLPKQNSEKCRFENILNEKPDLVVMEFLNDIVFAEDVLQRTYRTIHEQFAARGIEWVIVTPSQKIPENFDLAEMKDGQPRRLDNFLRRFAAEHGYALADAAARWKHLYKEGIPYFAMFNNGYNHPNASGHRLFVEEILKCFHT
jgi:lysophospholipase L1-like esterase